MKGRETGTVRQHKATTEYGSITTEYGERAFVHYNAFQGTGYRILDEGQSVSLSIVQGDRRERTANVETVV